jgi:transposase
MSEPTTERATAKPARSIYARLEAERRTLQAAYEAGRRRQIIEAAGIDPSKLSEQGQRILNWLAEWDDWTTGGIVELLQAARATALALHEHHRGIGR